MNYFRICVISTFLFNAVSLFGQNIAAFSGTSTPNANAVTNLTATPLTRGSGLTATASTTFSSANWTAANTIDTSDYIQWSIAVAPNYSVNVTGLDINYDRDPDNFLAQLFTGNGPAQIRLRSSVDNFTSNIFSDTNVSNNGETQNITTNLNSTVGGTITFRLYGYSSSAGIITDSGSFDIEGGLGTILSVSNTGIILRGTVIPNGLIYSNSVWTPNAPSASTGTNNALVLNGTYVETSNVEINNLTVNPGAGISVLKTGSLKVNGNLITNNNVTLQSDSDEYSSLIVNGSVTGTVAYNRHVNVTAASGQNDLIAPPVSGQTFGTLAAANTNIVANPSDISQKLFGPFNKTTGMYQIYDTDVPADANAILTAGIGYRAASTDNGGFLFSGTVTTTAVSRSILETGPQFQEWNLIGNPYPSYIKLSDFLMLNNSQFNTNAAGVYGYDGNASDGWTIWNLAYSTANPNAVLTPGQGFLVASKAGGGTIDYTPNMRSLGTTDDFIVGRSESIGFLKLNASKGSQQYSTDFYFIDDTTLGLDPGYDASIFGGSAPNFSIYSHLVNDNSGLDMGIQTVSFADVTESLSIPLGINVPEGQQVTVSLTESVLPENFFVFLEDNVNNTYTLLNTTDYVFTSNTSLSETGRFFLHFENSATLSTIEQQNKGLNIYSTNDNVLHIKGQLLENTSLDMYDSNGRLVQAFILDPSTAINTMDLSNLSSGVYVAKLINRLQTKTQKVIIR